MLRSRQDLEAQEEKTLAPYAVKSAHSRGRNYPEPEDPFRTCFQKDRDRVMHARASRRLKAKTQVFIADFGDHYRNRLSHTIEVAQISRDIARALGLNEDLAETIALAHDLGHPPFGHAGEAALDSLMGRFGDHFEHNEQSLRIVDDLEHVYPHFPGLNLTQEVRDGLLKHSTPWDRPRVSSLIRATLEAQVVNVADEIAYSSHDIDDGLRSGILLWNDVAAILLCREALMKVEMQYGPIRHAVLRRNRFISSLIGIAIDDLLHATVTRLHERNVTSVDDVLRSEEPLVVFSDRFQDIKADLRAFLTKHLYEHPRVLKHTELGKTVIAGLFNYFLSHPQHLPKTFVHRFPPDTSPHILVKDYIAGMTDAFAIARFRMVDPLRFSARMI